MGGPEDISNSIESAMKQLHDLKVCREKQKVPGTMVTCWKPSCRKDYAAEIGDFCNVCGSNQNIQEVSLLKKINKKPN